MKYFHRTHLAPDDVMARAGAFFGPRLAPTGERPRHLSFAGAIGTLAVRVEAEGGHEWLFWCEHLKRWLQVVGESS